MSEKLSERAMPKAVAEACEAVRIDAADTMQHTTTADLSARLMCRVDARKLGLVLAWVDQFARGGFHGSDVSHLRSHR